MGSSTKSAEKNPGIFDVVLFAPPQTTSPKGASGRGSEAGVEGTVEGGLEGGRVKEEEKTEGSWRERTEESTGSKMPGFFSA